MKNFIYFLLLLFLCLLGYANSLINDFMLDDFIILFGPNGVAQKSFIELFTSYSGDNYYRPIGIILLWASHQLFGQQVIFYHLLNVVLLTTISYLFFLITLRISLNNGLAILTASLYCLHPINNLYVNFVTASMLSMYVIFLQLSFFSFIHFYEHIKQKKIFVLSLLFFIFGMLSHETSATFPLIIAAYLYFVVKNTNGNKNRFLLSIPYFVVVVCYFLFRQLFFGKGNAALKINTFLSDVVLYINVLSDLLTWYVSKLFYPKNIVFIWNVDVIPQYLTISLIGILGMAAIFVWLIFIIWKRGLKPFALAVFCIGILPLCVAAFSYYPQTTPLIEPHWYYFTSYGFYLLIAIGLLKIKDKRNKFIGLISIIFILGGSLYLLWEGNAKFRNQETYCRFWLSQNQKNLTPYYGLGKSLMEKGEYRQAIQYFHEGVETTRIFHPMILADMGFSVFQEGNQDKALPYYNLALKLDPNYAPVHYYIYHYYAAKHNFPEAKAAIDRAILLYPSNQEYERAAMAIENMAK